MLVCAIPVFVIASIAMPAGVGGGMLYVPLMILTSVADPRSAAVLAQPIIVGAATAGNIFNIGWQMRHPDKMLLDGKLALAMIAPCLAGNLLGTILNQSLPALVILIFLLLLIAHSFYGSVFRARAMWTNENRLTALEVAQANAQPTVVGVEEDSTRPPSSAPSVTNDDELAAADVEGETFEPPETSEPETAAQTEQGTRDEDDMPYQQVSFFSDTSANPRIYRRRNRTRTETLESGLSTATTNTCPESVSRGGESEQAQSEQSQSEQGQSEQTQSCCTWLEFVLVWIAMLALVAIRGGDGYSIVGMPSCSWEYWFVTGIGFLALLLVGFMTKRQEVGTLACVAVGCLSACVGIGGAVVLNPMMVKGGVEVQTATATASLLVLVMSSSVSTLFLLGGAVPLMPAVTLSAAAFLGSMVGKSTVAYLVKRTGRTSLLVILLAIFIFVSGMAVLVQTITELAGSKAGGSVLHFKSPC